MNPDKATESVEEIIDNLHARSGFDVVIESCTPKVQREIKLTLANLIREQYGEDIQSDDQARQIRTTIRLTLSDLVTKFMYYDRKEDEDLSLDDLKHAFETEIVTVEECIEWFAESMRSSE